MAKKNQVARNERERKRVHQVNHGFDVLRNRLQPKNHTKKWSKADTLREAVKYIQQLQLLLNQDQASVSTSTPSTCDYSANSTTSSTSNYSTFPPKEEFEMYLGQPYHHHSNQPPIQSFSTSPSSSVSSSSFSPSQHYQQHHNLNYPPYVHQ